MSELVMRYPLRMDSRGVVVGTRKDTEIWADRVRMLLSTYKSERVGKLEYGTEVEEALFSGMGLTPYLVEASVSQAIAEYLPELSNVQVVSVEDLTAETGIDVTVWFTPPNSSETSVTTALSIESLILNRI